MRFRNLLLFAPLLLTLTACPVDYEQSLKAIKNNNMDFPDPEGRSHDGISYELSKLFEDSYYTNYVIQKNATTKSIYDLYLHFSIETFTNSDLETLQFIEGKKNEDLKTIHDYYIRNRMASLHTKRRSMLKKVPKKVGFQGYITVVDGQGEYDEKQATYFISTIKIDDNFYVFQMIGNKDKMGYFYDDFLDILNSIEK